MEIDSTSQEKLRLKDVREDEQEEVKRDNCNAGEFHITTVLQKLILVLLNDLVFFQSAIPKLLLTRVSQPHSHSLDKADWPRYQH